MVILWGRWVDILPPNEKKRKSTKFNKKRSTNATLASSQKVVQTEKGFESQDTEREGRMRRGLAYCCGEWMPVVESAPCKNSPNDLGSPAEPLLPLVTFFFWWRMMGFFFVSNAWPCKSAARTRVMSPTRTQRGFSSTLAAFLLLLRWHLFQQKLPLHKLPTSNPGHRPAP